ncbi:MAG: hypothetical protein M1438_20430 [Deltaproteobacteria bacterium]|nr:hypothetical protein [Deltaproteobacteria bacterium]
MSYQEAESNYLKFIEILKAYGVGLAYFFGSQQELGPLLLQGQKVAGKPESDLDLGIVFLEHPWDYREAEKIRRRLQEVLSGLFSPVRLHLLLLAEENAHVQYAAIRGIPAYVAAEKFARAYRRQVLTLYGDWHSWW